jgi:hypothetical protein
LLQAFFFFFSPPLLLFTATDRGKRRVCFTGSRGSKFTISAQRTALFLQREEEKKFSLAAINDK